jgi:hypothetical protein
MLQVCINSRGPMTVHRSKGYPSNSSPISHQHVPPENDDSSIHTHTYRNCAINEKYRKTEHQTSSVTMQMVAANSVQTYGVKCHN